MKASVSMVEMPPPSPAVAEALKAIQWALPLVRWGLEFKPWWLPGPLAGLPLYLACVPPRLHLWGRRLLIGQRP